MPSLRNLQHERFAQRVEKLPFISLTKVQVIDYSVFSDEEIEMLSALARRHEAAVAAKRAGALPAAAGGGDATSPQAGRGRQLAAAGNNGGGGAVAGEPERIEMVAQLSGESRAD